MELIVVSGTSGSGKSIALHALEDNGYYCIDNLPVGLIPAFMQQLQLLPPGPCQCAAIGVDVRTMHNATDTLKQTLQTLQQFDASVRTTIFFLDANDAVLIKRYSETRRRHPLTNKDRSLEDAITQERLLLQPVKELADFHIDTSATSVHQLYRSILKEVAIPPGQKMSILFNSFGFKYGAPVEADMVFDVRCVANPHWVPELRTLTGKDAAVVAFLQQDKQVESMYQDIYHFLQNWIPAFAKDNRSYITIAIGCTGGQHRSVYFSERLAAAFRQMESYPVQLHHRELDQ